MIAFGGSSDPSNLLGAPRTPRSRLAARAPGTGEFLMPSDLAPSLGGRKIDKIDKMAEIGGRTAAIYQMLGLPLAPISTICRGGAQDG